MSTIGNAICLWKATITTIISLKRYSYVSVKASWLSLPHTPMLRIALANRSILAYEPDMPTIRHYKPAYYRYVYQPPLPIGNKSTTELRSTVRINAFDCAPEKAKKSSTDERVTTPPFAHETHRRLASELSMPTPGTPTLDMSKNLAFQPLRY
jgi:hypothetical protein